MKFNGEITLQNLRMAHGRMRILVSCSWSYLAAAATSCVKAHSDLIAWDGKIFGRDLSFEILDDFVYILNFEIETSAGLRKTGLLGCLWLKERNLKFTI